ncbi:MAG: phenylpyruvate tautomerase MIF-related protein [Pseudomonadota bacterium]
MPLLSLHTNLALEPEQESALAQQLSLLVSRLTHKPEQWVMVRVASAQTMHFASSDLPCAYLECKSIGLPDAQIPALAKEISALLHQGLQLDPARVYIEFASALPQHWGWNSGTF